MTSNFPAVPLSAYVIASVLLATMLALAALTIWLMFGTLRLAVAIDGNALRVTAPFYGREIPFREIRRDGIAIVDLTNDRFVPMLRSNGVALPGLRLGRYRLASGLSGHLVTTTSKSALAVPLTDGSVWLLGVREPEQLRRALLAALDTG